MEYKLLFVLVVFSTINAVKSNEMADGFSLGSIVDHISNDFDKAKDCYQQVQNTYVDAISDFKDEVLSLPEKIFDGIGLGSLFKAGKAAHSNLKAVTNVMSKFNNKLKGHFANNDKAGAIKTASKFRPTVSGLWNTYNKYKNIFEENYHTTTNQVAPNGCSFDCVTNKKKDVFQNINDVFEKCNLLNIIS